MNVSQRNAALFFFVHLGLWNGVHAGAWRDPNVPPTYPLDFQRIKAMVQTAERGKLHGIFLADSLAFMDHMSAEALSRSPESEWHEPFTLCSALAACTTKIGLALTANTTYNEPYHVARKLASLDHLSGGRVAWNVVAGGNRVEAKNFSRMEHMEHAQRYERAEEFVDVVTGLWDSWEDDAFIRDRESGTYFEIDKLRPLNHEGRFFSVAGPLTIPRPVQGYPVIAQAGSSPDGLKLAARIGEVVFTHQHDIEKAREFYFNFKNDVAAQGRNPDDVLLMPHLIMIVGRTEDEAEERLQRLDGLSDPRLELERLAFIIDFDLSGYPLDGPVPEIPVSKLGSRTLQHAYLELARKDNLTVREMTRLASRGRTLAVSPERVADHIEEWVTTGAADGFNIAFADGATSLNLFVEHVVPELQRRGIFHSDYRGSTLREHLGLSRPPNRHASVRVGRGGSGGG